MLLIKCGAQAGSVSLKMHSKGGLDTFLKLFCDCSTGRPQSSPLQSYKLKLTAR